MSAWLPRLRRKFRQCVLGMLREDCGGSLTSRGHGRRNRINEGTTHHAERTSGEHNILRSDPQRYLRIVNGWIRDNPTNFDAYFSRHFAWMNLGEPRRALDDLNNVIELKASPTRCHFGRVAWFIAIWAKTRRHCRTSIAAMRSTRQWEEDIVFGLLYQADVHARLGNEAAAWHLARAFRTTSGLRACAVRPAAAKPTLQTNSAALLRRPGTSECEVRRCEASTSHAQTRSPAENRRPLSSWPDLFRHPRLCLRSAVQTWMPAIRAGMTDRKTTIP